MTPRLLPLAVVAALALAGPGGAGTAQACTPETCPPNELCEIKQVRALGFCPPWS